MDPYAVKLRVNFNLPVCIDSTTTTIQASFVSTLLVDRAEDPADAYDQAVESMTAAVLAAGGDSPECEDLDIYIHRDNPDA